MDKNPQNFDEFISQIPYGVDALFCSWWLIEEGESFPGANGIQTVGGNMVFGGTSFEKLNPDLTFNALITNAQVGEQWNLCIVWAEPSLGQHPPSQEQIQNVIKGKLAKMDQGTPEGSPGWSKFAGGMAFDTDGARIDKVVFPAGMTR